MKYTIDVMDYDNSIELEYSENSRISSRHSEYGETVINANKDGLITLAKVLLTLAQDSVPSGAHIHLDDFNFLEDGSSEVILVRWDNWDEQQKNS